MKVVRKILIVLVTMVLVLLFAFGVYNFVCVKILKQEYASINGYTILEVVSGSMEPTIHVGDLIVINTKDNDYHANDIVTFYDVEGSFVTHRIISISDDLMITKGDNNNTEDESTSTDKLIGKYVFRIGGLGRLLSSFRSPITMGMILFIGILICYLVSTDKNGKPLFTEEEKEFDEFLEYQKTNNNSNKDVIITNKNKITTENRKNGVVVNNKIKTISSNKNKGEVIKRRVRTDQKDSENYRNNGIIVDRKQEIKKPTTKYVPSNKNKEKVIYNKFSVNKTKRTFDNNSNYKKSTVVDNKKEIKKPTTKYVSSNKNKGKIIYNKINVNRTEKTLDDNLNYKKKSIVVNDKRNIEKPVNKYVSSNKNKGKVITKKISINGNYKKKGTVVDSKNKPSTKYVQSSTGKKGIVVNKKIVAKATDKKTSTYVKNNFSQNKRKTGQKEK